MDELMYFTDAYNNGMRYNAMVGQAQRICECLLKHVISKRLVNNNEVMKVTQPCDGTESMYMPERA